MRSYRLSIAAKQDFMHIFDYGLENFGIAQTVHYQHKLQEYWANKVLKALYSRKK